MINSVIQKFSTTFTNLFVFTKLVFSSNSQTKNRKNKNIYLSFKVHGKETPSHEDIDRIIEYIAPFTKEKNKNYTYLSDIDSSTDQRLHRKKVSPCSKKKSRSSMLIIIVVICLIGIVGVMFVFYDKYWKKRRNNELKKQRSDFSDESQMSRSNSTRDISAIPMEEFSKQAKRNLLRLDDQI